MKRVRAATGTCYAEPPKRGKMVLKKVGQARSGKDQGSVHPGDVQSADIAALYSSYISGK